MSGIKNVDKIKRNNGCECCKFYVSTYRCFHNIGFRYHPILGKIYEENDVCLQKNSKCECEDFVKKNWILRLFKLNVNHRMN